MARGKSKAKRAEQLPGLASPLLHCLIRRGVSKEQIREEGRRRRTWGRESALYDWERGSSGSCCVRGGERGFSGCIVATPIQPLVWEPRRAPLSSQPQPAPQHCARKGAEGQLPGERRLRRRRRVEASRLTAAGSSAQYQETGSRSTDRERIFTLQSAKRQHATESAPARTDGRRPVDEAPLGSARSPCCAQTIPRRATSPRAVALAAQQSPAARASSLRPVKLSRRSLAGS